MRGRSVCIELPAGLRLLGLLLATISFAPCQEAPCQEMEWVRISEDGQGFALAASGRRFVPWGFNYDHDSGGRLIEDYWDEQWEVVEADFAEMRDLGANVVRVHLQFGKFMEDEVTPRAPALARLRQLIELAERTGLYLDLTGLGCYHKADVPTWYDALDEQSRWRAQAAFWRAVAETCATSPAIFCYDLMNEPVVPGGSAKREDWLAGSFGGKHFVQFIALETAGRERTDIARSWIAQMVAAIHEHDGRHLITVGLVPWSLARPGLQSGFDPTKVSEQLDFVAVHIYPESQRLDEALETVRGFAQANKPVLIEEMFPLKCSAAELEEFIDRSKTHAAGWIGFYWGTPPTELAPPKTIGEALLLSWLELFERRASSIRSGGADEIRQPGGASEAGSDRPNAEQSNGQR